ncbi:uncharacterized threonine-rich GPI-anchored glycoprotein PJ4664.02 isoform X2 [Nematostella vectensis]|uniref:uncharacterized threonine-rich GPI-anchored glycoprotein PJ4664.02 isoform X2 n=1 Tax=Nematostella vectensis TaxID=45351 RepID=UPI0020770CE6|nr:uncharacterized threonine-rich GPI-anchored glycoprotein PJ4664.02 isoform X2 [Nematostella vectensis]
MISSEGAVMSRNDMVTLESIIQKGSVGTDHKQLQSAILQLMKNNSSADEDTSVNRSTDEQGVESAKTRHVESSLEHASGDVRVHNPNQMVYRRSHSYPELSHFLTASESDVNDDDVFLPSHIKTRTMSTRELNRWRLTLFSVFVGRLPYDITKRELAQLFDQIGPVQDLHIAPREGSMSYTYGFVRFLTLEEANEAVTQLHGRVLGNRHITVELSQETRRVHGTSADELPNNRRDKLIRREYPSVRHLDGNSEEAAIQQKLLHSTAQLKACYEQQDSNGTALLSKLENILKKVRCVPGETLGTPVADEGKFCVFPRITRAGHLNAQLQPTVQAATLLHSHNGPSVSFSPVHTKPVVTSTPYSGSDLSSPNENNGQQITLPHSNTISGVPSHHSYPGSAMIPPHGHTALTVTSPHVENGPQDTLPHRNSGPQVTPPYGHTAPVLTLPHADNGPQATPSYGHSGSVLTLSHADNGPKATPPYGHSGSVLTLPHADNGPKATPPHGHTALTVTSPHVENGPQDTLPHRNSGPQVTPPYGHTAPVLTSPHADNGPQTTPPDGHSGSVLTLPHADNGPQVSPLRSNTGSMLPSDYANSLSGLSSTQSHTAPSVLSPHADNGQQITPRHEHTRSPLNSPHADAGPQVTSPHANTVPVVPSHCTYSGSGLTLHHKDNGPQVTTPDADKGPKITLPHGYTEPALAQDHTYSGSGLCSPHAVNGPHVTLTHANTVPVVPSHQTYSGSGLTSPNAINGPQITSPNDYNESVVHQQHAANGRAVTSLHPYSGPGAPLPHSETAVASLNNHNRSTVTPYHEHSGPAVTLPQNYTTTEATKPYSYTGSAVTLSHHYTETTVTSRNAHIVMPPTLADGHIGLAVTTPTAQTRSAITSPHAYTVSSVTAPAATSPNGFSGPEVNSPNANTGLKSISPHAEFGPAITPTHADNLLTINLPSAKSGPEITSPQASSILTVTSTMPRLPVPSEMVEARSLRLAATATGPLMSGVSANSSPQSDVHEEKVKNLSEDKPSATSHRNSQGDKVPAGFGRGGRVSPPVDIYRPVKQFGRGSSLNALLLTQRRKNPNNPIYPESSINGSATPALCSPCNKQSEENTNLNLCPASNPRGKGTAVRPPLLNIQNSGKTSDLPGSTTVPSPVLNDNKAESEARQPKCMGRGMNRTNILLENSRPRMESYTLQSTSEPGKAGAPMNTVNLQSTPSTGGQKLHGHPRSMNVSPQPLLPQVHLMNATYPLGTPALNNSQLARIRLGLAILSQQQMMLGGYGQNTGQSVVENAAIGIETSQDGDLGASPVLEASELEAYLKSFYEDAIKAGFVKSEKTTKDLSFGNLTGGKPVSEGETMVTPVSKEDGHFQDTLASPVPSKELGNAGNSHALQLEATTVRKTTYAENGGNVKMDTANAEKSGNFKMDTAKSEIGGNFKMDTANAENGVDVLKTSASMVFNNEQFSATSQIKGTEKDTRRIHIPNKVESPENDLTNAVNTHILNNADASIRDTAETVTDTPIKDTAIAKKGKAHDFVGSQDTVNSDLLYILQPAADQARNVVDTGDLNRLHNVASQAIDLINAENVGFTNAVATLNRIKDNTDDFNGLQTIVIQARDSEKVELTDSLASQAGEFAITEKVHINSVAPSARTRVITEEYKLPSSMVNKGRGSESTDKEKMADRRVALDSADVLPAKPMSAVKPVFNVDSDDISHSVDNSSNKKPGIYDEIYPSIKKRSSQDESLVKMKTALRSLLEDNQRLERTLPKRRIEPGAGGMYPNEEKRRLEEAIHKCQVDYQREVEIIFTRNAEFDLLCEREKLAAGYDSTVVSEPWKTIC